MDPNSPPKITPELLQQNPSLMIAVFIVMGLFTLYVVGGISSWIFFGNRLNQGKPLLAVETWTPRAWGLADLLVIVLATGFCQILFIWLGHELFGVKAEEGKIPIALAMWAGFGNLAAVVVGVLWIVMRYGVSFAHVGITTTRALKQLGIGVLVGFGTLPMIYALMMLVSLGFQTEYSHPLIDEMTRHGTVAVFLMGCITAAIIAPVTEEFLFRVIIQGWLQSIPFRSALTNVLGGRSEASAPSSDTVTDDRVVDASVEPPEDDAPEFGANPFRPSSDAVIPTTTDFVPPVWPTFVSGTLFGLAHWGYGLSFIPLIALGIVLGFVYRATHSIWPCILIHCMLNGTSMALMGFAMLTQQVAQ